MNTKDLLRLGVRLWQLIALAHEFMQTFVRQGGDGAALETEIFAILANPPAFFGDTLRAPLARAICGPSFTPRGELAPWRQWGEGLEPEAVKQMANACALPVAVAGALMPDAHVGYGLPIGGVLATDNAVIPYAVGVDIACRMKLTVYDRKANTIAGQRDRLANFIESETRFGMGCEFKQRRQHDVMDEDWSVSPITQQLRDKAWKQLGTSGSGNHFVEFGAFTSMRPRHRRWIWNPAISRRYSRSVAPAGPVRRSASTTANAPWLGTSICRPRAQASLVALAGRRRWPGILGRHAADGTLRRGKSRAHPPAPRPEARRARASRH